MGIHGCGVLPSPVLASDWPISAIQRFHGRVSSSGTSACFIFELGPGSGGPLRLGPTGGGGAGTDYILAHPLIWPVWGFRHGFGVDGVLETDLSFGLDGPPGGNGICGAGAGTYAAVPAPPGQPVPPPICGDPGMGTWGETQLEVWRQV